jgi:type I restriction enzyme S subunit
MLICNQPECHIARQIMAIRNIYDLDIDFLRYTLSFHILKITEAARGIIPGISREDLLVHTLPLPPLAEQRRIVVAIESAFAVIDEIERNKADLQAAVAVVKSKILSLAVSGKLVRQDENDEPAAVLLERIKTERFKLIKAGEIKADKRGKDAAAPRDNSYYEKLPAGWEVATVDSLFDIVGGGTPSTLQTEYWGEGTPWFSSADIDESGNIAPRRSVTKLGLESSTTNVVEKDCVVVVTRVGLGKVAVLACDMCFSQDSQALVPYFKEALYNRYVYYFLFHEMQSLKHAGHGTTISGITKKQLADIVFSLPPYAEQKRIADMITALYWILDAITSSTA